MSELRLRVEHEAAGATYREVGGSQVVRHYGDAGGEYDAIRSSAGIVERSDLTQLRLWGRDPVRMLNGLITNDLSRLATDQAVYGAMLTPKGRMITDLRALTGSGAAGGELLVDLPVAALASVEAHLQKYLPPHFARWQSLAGDFGVIGVYGPAAPAILRGALGIDAVPAEEDGVARMPAAGAASADEGQVSGENDCEPGAAFAAAVATRIAGGEPGFDLFAPTAALPSLWRALTRFGASVGGRPAGFDALETLRVEAGRPRYGLDMTEDTMPAEVFEAGGMMPRAVSFKKGCYTGQEVVVRIAHRGHVNRHLRGLLLGDAPVPGPRTSLHAVDAEAKEVGWTTSSVYSPLMRQTVALGYLRRGIEASASVRLGGPSGGVATVVELPFAGAIA